MTRPRLLVLGGPSSGKTTYRTQLYQRIERQAGQLRLLKSVSDMTALEGDVGRLVQGLQPMHTHLDTYHSTTFSVEDSANRSFTLEFPDYGGEQLRRVADSNFMPRPWVERAQQADRWLFFVRIDPLRAAKSFMTDPVATNPAPDAGGAASSAEPSTEFDAIEALQRMLFVRGSSLREPLSTPRLGVLLSCWDELTAAERQLPPAKVLAQRAPLLSAFIGANWLDRGRRIWGLSSTERKLPEDKPDEEFARRGPQHFGYVVVDGGAPDPDLTIPVAWLTQAG